MEVVMIWSGSSFSADLLADRNQSFQSVFGAASSGPRSIQFLGPVFLFSCFRRALITPWITKLSDSVAPEVNITSSVRQFKKSATLFLAWSTPATAFWPNL